MKGKVNCTCGWSWNKSDSSAKDMYICHQCGRDNSNNMKNGGDILQAQDGTKTISPRQKKGVELQIKELKKEQADKKELQTTGQIKNPKSISYKKKKESLEKKQTYVSQDNRTDFEREKDREKGQAIEDKKQFRKNVLAPLDVATDIMQLGNFVPHPIGQTIGGIGNIAGGIIDGYQAYDDFTEGNYGSAAVNLASATLPVFLEGAGYTRDMYNTNPGSIADKIASLGNRSGSYIPLTTLPNKIAPSTIKGINYNRSLLGALGAETVYDIPKQKNGGWLDNYGTQANYNDSKATASPDMVGDGFSNVGRNYSPAWGGQFQEGGEIPMAQNGDRATRADSLAVYNNSKLLEDYFNKQQYKKTNLKVSPNLQAALITAKKWQKKAMNSPIDTLGGLLTVEQAKKEKQLRVKEESKWVNKEVAKINKEKKEIKNKSDVNKYLSNLEKSRKEFNERLPGWSRYTDEQGIKRNESKILPEQYYKPLNENQFYQRESSSGNIDLRSPMALYDTRISPQSFSVFDSPDLVTSDALQHQAANTNDSKKRDKLYKQLYDYLDNPNTNTDRVEMYQYDPLAVMPFDMVPPELQEERIRKYGTEGVPASFIEQHPDWVTKPITDSGQRQPVQSIQNNLKPKGLIQSNADVSGLKPQVRQPKYYDIQENINQPFGATQKNYRISDLNNITSPDDLGPGNTRKIVPHYQKGGKLKFLQPTSDKLPEGYRIPYDTPSTERASSIGGTDGEPAYLVPEFKYGQPIYDSIEEFKRTGEHLGGPFKTWQEAEEWENTVRHPAVENRETIMFPQEKFQTGGSIPGSVGFTYARTKGIPSNGPYAKKTLASAQNGVDMYGNPITAELKYDQSVNRTNYNPRTNQMIFGNDMPYFLSQEQRDKTLAHENRHAWQFANDRTNFNIVHQPEYAFQDRLKKKPEQPSTDEVFNSYHDRKQREVAIDVNKFKASYPELSFMPDELIYKRFVDSQQYDNPLSVEGEAQYYENTGERSFQNGGEMKFYQNGLDFKPKSISRDGGWLNKYDVAQNGKKKFKLKDERLQAIRPSESTFVKKPNFEAEQAKVQRTYVDQVGKQMAEEKRRKKLTKDQREREDYNARNEQKGSIQAHVPESIWDRTKAIVSNPLTAIGYKVRGENLPERFQFGPRNEHDYAVDWINPLQGAAALSEIPGELGRGEFLNAGLSALDAADLGVYARGAGKALGTKSGLLSNAYKVNPYAEKLKNVNKSYRVAGLDAYEDFKNTGVLKSKLPELSKNATLLERAAARPTAFPSFQKGYADMSYASPKGSVVFETGLPTFKRGEINPVTGFPIKGRHYAHRVIDTKTGATMSEIPASDIRVFGDKPHWWKGYQEVPKQEEGGVIKDDRGQWEHPGEITEISGDTMATHGYGDIPLYVVPDKGKPRLVQPNTGTQKFPGAKKFTEFPMAKNGRRQEQKGLVNLDDLTNFTNYNKQQPGGWLSKYN